MKLHWGHGILIFILLFLAVITTFVIFALFQSQDLVSDDYYDRGASYSDQIATNKRSEIYRDSINIENEGNEISVRLSKTLAGSGDSLHLYFYRPSDKKQDFQVNCLMTDMIALPRNRFSPGHYVVKIMWGRGNELYNVNKDLNIQ
jgi:hypothetical protein